MFLTEGALSVDTALTTATSLFNWVVSSITSNPILTAAFVVSALIPAGIAIFRHLKNAV
jgi:hypothetical protein